jgi:hypothetical protein
MTRRGAAAVALGAGLGVGAASVLATYGGFLALRPFDRPVAMWCAGWALFVAAIALFRPRGKQWLATPIVLGLAYATLFAAFTAHLFDTTDEVLVEKVAVQGREVRLVRGLALDPVLEVRVRTRDGLLSREWSIWSVEASGGTLRVTAEGTIRVYTATAGTYDVRL